VSKSALFRRFWAGGLADMTPSASSTPARAPDHDHDRTTLSQWVAVVALSLSTFIVVTSEMLPVGVLTPMADGLGISSGAVGSSLTITGLVTAVTAPAVSRLLGNADRRLVLAVAMVVLAAGNALTALAQGFALLMVSRIILGIGMGTVWGLAAAVATRLVAPRNAALAVSFAVSGVAAASVFGVPLGTLIGNGFGWRAAFAALAVGALLLAAGLLVTVPLLGRSAASSATAGAEERHLLVRPAVLTGLVVVFFLVTAHFAAYTYVRPLLEEQTELSADPIALLLLLYGIFGMIGNFTAGALAARRPRPTVLLLAAGIGVAIAILALFGTAATAAGLGIALWGLAYGGLSVAGQLWMTEVAPDRVEHITGLYVGGFTASIALGAFAGGILVEAAGTVPLLWSAAGVAALALTAGLLGPGPKPHTPFRPAEAATSRRCRPGSRR
jgi:predicted MFS family arabinose efflux permease